MLQARTVRAGTVHNDMNKKKQPCSLFFDLTPIILHPSFRILDLKKPSSAALRRGRFF
jgi:hypothetical protein